MDDMDDLIEQLDDVLQAGGICDLAFHIGQVKALVEDQNWRRRWHTRLGRAAGETEGRFYERIERALDELGFAL